MANLPRIYEVIDFIEKNQSLKLQFNQREWATTTYDRKGNDCGTAMCFAGWTRYYELLQQNPNAKIDLIQVGVNSVATAAAKYLDLTIWEESYLFTTDVGHIHTVNDLRQHVKRMDESWQIEAHEW
jgi:hypothetical protein